MNSLFKKILLVSLVWTLVFSGVVWAEEIPVPEAAPASPPAFVSLRIVDGGTSVEVGEFALPVAGMAGIEDSLGEAHEVDAQSVLAVLYEWDQVEDGFELGELVYYPSFGALYLRCITLQGEAKCDNWLYEVNGKGPSVGMDSFVLQEGDSVEIHYEVFDWGIGEEDGEEEVIAPDEAPPEAVEPEPEQISGSSGGGRIRAKLATKEEVEPEKIIVPVAAEVPIPAHIAFPEFYTPEQNAGETQTQVDRSEAEQIAEPVEKNLSASVAESEASLKPFALILAGLLAIVLVAIFRN